jgi:hypothetical protein
MDANTFKNGLIGHKVEVKAGRESPLQILTIIDKVNLGDTDSDDGRRFATNSDMYMVMNEAGMVDRIEPSSIVRVIRPQGEAPKPAEPYSIATMVDAQRLINEVMLPAGFTSFWGNEGEYMTADRDNYRIKIDETGVYLIARLPEDPRAGYVYDAHNGINIPLNEWVKNPTIEALMPKP